jgi:Beta-ketoacyl synthase, C-terminal domain
VVIVVEAAGGQSSQGVLVPGSAVNQGGRSSGLTAPNGPAQAQVIKLDRWQIRPKLDNSLSACIYSHADQGNDRNPWSDLGGDPEPPRVGSMFDAFAAWRVCVQLIKSVISAAGGVAVEYVAIHGTGTPLGDPIEANALGRALAGGLQQDVTVGSVKSCFGHTEGAAGLSGGRSDSGFILDGWLHLGSPAVIVVIPASLCNDMACWAAVLAPTGGACSSRGHAKLCGAQAPCCLAGCISLHLPVAAQASCWPCVRCSSRRTRP